MTLLDVLSHPSGTGSCALMIMLKFVSWRNFVILVLPKVLYFLNSWPHTEFKELFVVEEVSLGIGLVI
jgi:hypothetical protein